MKDKELELQKFIKFHQDRIERILERIDDKDFLFNYMMDVCADHKKAIEDYKKEIAELK